MDNGLTLDNYAMLDKLKTKANEIVSLQAKISELQKLIVNLDSIPKDGFDIIYVGKYHLTLNSPSQLKLTLRTEFEKQIKPIAKQILEQMLQQEIKKIKQLIGE